MNAKLICRPEDIVREFQEILSLEEKAAQVYHQLAQDCDHPEVRRMLEKMAGEEREHAGYARELVEIVTKYLQAP